MVICILDKVGRSVASRHSNLGAGAVIGDGGGIAPAASRLHLHEVTLLPRLVEACGSIDTGRKKGPGGAPAGSLILGSGALALQPTRSRHLRAILTLRNCFSVQVPGGLQSPAPTPPRETTSANTIPTSTRCANNCVPINAGVGGHAAGKRIGTTIRSRTMNVARP